MSPRPARVPGECRRRIVLSTIEGRECPPGGDWVLAPYEATVVEVAAK